MAISAARPPAGPAVAPVAADLTVAKASLEARPAVVLASRVWAAFALPMSGPPVSSCSEALVVGPRALNCGSPIGASV